MCTLIYVLLRPQAIHEGMEKNLNKWNKKAENKVKVNHFYVRSGWEAVGELQHINWSTIYS